MKKTYIYIAVAVVIIIAGFYAYRAYGKSSALKSPGTGDLGGASATPTTDAGTEVTAPTSQYVEANDFPLQENDKGELVLKLQQSLNKLYDAGLVEDGYFGPKTKEACLEFLFVDTISSDMYAETLQKASEDSYDVWSWLSDAFNF
jgi:peptidoglycan hydrolase-like protein with peptidoglycan-binding domain